MLAAVNLFASTLQSNFEYVPEHYFVIKQTTFSKFVDALDGVDVVLPAAVDGRAEGKNYYEAGAQHLNGAMALDLVRINVDGEWARFDRQELIIQAIYQALLTPQNWNRLPAIIDTFHDNVLTDLSTTQMLEISCILNQPGVEVNQEQISPDLLTLSGQTMLPGPELGHYILDVVGK
jgi:anionic cell wall polymer biosynthesis LytR-Cps2A-Psr (LCP) family protein